MRPWDPLTLIVWLGQLRQKNGICGMVSLSLPCNLVMNPKIKGVIHLPTDTVVPAGVLIGPADNGGFY